MKSYKSDEPCIICGNPHACMHHVKSRGAGGSDAKSNLMPLCLEHHNEIHRKGRDVFTRKHPRAYRWMIQNNWESCPVTGKWIHRGE
ncbi:DUF968 domain-containing protein [Candidatus Saccharibacteria bacterium]|nr:DUF968 domain-containing protein [Candidatus Saccharibacteria bacterium]